MPGTAVHAPRVLILIKELGLGGAERLVADVLANRDSGSFHYEVAYVLRGHDTLVPAIEATGVPVHCLGSTNSTDLRWMGRLRRLLVARSFDILHAHLPYTAALGRIVAASMPRGHRPVLAYTEHSLWNKAGVISKSLNRATVHLDDALFVVSSASRDALPVALRPRAQVVVHGVDRARTTSLVAHRDEVQRQVRAELAVPDDELLVLTVANLRTEKGYDTLLEAARLAIGRGARVHFVSVGWGPLAETLAQERDRAGLAGRFTFLGRRDDSLRIMTGADVFVLPSHQEGLPLALMEAMSVGLPIVATAIGGVPDIVTHGVEGLLVPPGHAKELADAIVEVTEDEPMRARMATAALARGQGLDVAEAARTIEDTYRKLLEARRP
jgi:L-malate glycosyltransferase